LIIKEIRKIFIKIKARAGHSVEMGRSAAELLYRSLDYIAAGVIPRYARGALTPELQGTTIMYKELTPAKGDP